MLRAEPILSDDQIGVDYENRVINGYVVAQEGRFKSEGRGQFTSESLDKLVELGNEKPGGIRCRFGHPNASDDGLGKFLGRSKNFRRDADKVRADLFINETAMKTPPHGGRALGDYVMELASTDPGAFSSSIVVSAEKEEIDGQPPVWHPDRLYASDVVDTGDAVDDFLSADFLEDLPTGTVYQATKLIDEKFDGLSRDVVEARLRAFCEKYLSHKFGEVEPEVEKGDLEMPQDDIRIEALEKQATETANQLSELTKATTALFEQLSADREAAQQRSVAEDRARRITALCASCGLDSKQANEWIADECLTVDDVKDKLLAIKFEKQVPAGKGEEDLSTDSLYIKEFNEHREVHRKLGVTQEDFVQMRKVEDGKAEDDFDYMSPEWAEEYRNSIAS